MPVPEDDAEERLDLEIGQSRALVTGKRANLVEGEVDVVAQHRVERVGRRGDLTLTDAQVRRRPAVQLSRPSAYRGEAPSSTSRRIRETVSRTSWLTAGRAVARLRYVGMLVVLSVVVLAPMRKAAQPRERALQLVVRRCVVEAQMPGCAEDLAGHDGDADPLAQRLGERRRRVDASAADGSAQVLLDRREGVEDIAAAR
jgi:hypothetical protein